MGSKRFSLSEFDWHSIGRGALIALAGLFLTYVLPVLLGFTYEIPTPNGTIDITPWAIVFFQVLANITRKFLSDTTQGGLK